MATSELSSDLRACGSELNMGMEALGVLRAVRPGVPEDCAAAEVDGDDDGGVAKTLFAGRCRGLLPMMPLICSCFCGSTSSCPACLTLSPAGPSSCCCAVWAACSVFSSSCCCSDSCVKKRCPGSVVSWWACAESGPSDDLRSMVSGCEDCGGASADEIRTVKTAS